MPYASAVSGTDIAGTRWAAKEKEKERTASFKQRVQSTGAATDMKLSPDLEHARAAAAKQKEEERQRMLQAEREHTQNLRKTVESTGARADHALSPEQEKA
eukprot:3471635-Rhodomonas_salina.2